MSTSLFVAIFGLGVAFAGFIVNAVAIRHESVDRKHQIDDAWAREWAAQRPVLYPLASADWVYARGLYAQGNRRLLPIKNGGRGPAINVTGEVWARAPEGSEYQRELIAGTIAAGDVLDARLAPDPGIEHWETARGVVRYGDLVGGSYETSFQYELGPGNELAISISSPEQHQTAVAPWAATT